MKILGSRRHYYVARISILLIMIALIAGMEGCLFPPATRNLQIRTWYDLDAIRDNLGSHHILMNDLDSTTAGYEELASPTTNQGQGWQPIGTLVDPFEGSLDGQGYEIRDLFTNRPEEDFVGLFGIVDEGGLIKDIGVVNVTVTGNSSVGGLVGGNVGTVSNSYSSDSVDSGNDKVGGLVGWNVGNVSNSYSSDNVYGGSDHVGGLVGMNTGTVSNSYSSDSVTGNGHVGGLVAGNSGTVSNSYSTGNVNGYYGVGGLVGVNSGIVNNSYSTGNVTGNQWVGGLVAGNSGTVSNSYSTGNVNGNQSVGGLVGQNDGTVANSYSIGGVIGISSVGGLVGYSEGTVTNSFWNTETSGQATSDGGTGKTTAQMRNIATFSAWNIVAVTNSSMRNPAYIWNIVNNTTYPFLSWQP